MVHEERMWVGMEVTDRGKEPRMGTEDKARNMGEDLKGKAKEATGKVTDNESLEAEGKQDQAAADLKQRGEHLKDAVKPD
jgi:uncharacterized protein YjbJ (UPF0337 family)